MISYICYCLLWTLYLYRVAIKIKKQTTSVSSFDLYLLVLFNFLNDGKLLVLKDVLFRFFPVFQRE